MSKYNPQNTLTLPAPGGGIIEVPASANAVDMFAIARLAGFNSFDLFAEPIGLRLAYEWLGNENAKITAPTVERHMVAMAGPPSRA